jgi:hypothetical protein
MVIIGGFLLTAILVIAKAPREYVEAALNLTFVVIVVVSLRKAWREGRVRIRRYRSSLKEWEDEKRATLETDQTKKTGED